MEGTILIKENFPIRNSRNADFLRALDFVNVFDIILISIFPTLGGQMGCKCGANSCSARIDNDNFIQGRGPYSGGRRSENNFTNCPPENLLPSLVRNPNRPGWFQRWFLRSEDHKYLERISGLDLSAVESQLVTKGWQPEKTLQVRKEYLEFLSQFQGKDTFEAVVPPSQDIDDFWHQHVLNTKKYADDCFAVFGRFLHHDPSTFKEDRK